jgi:hypothetical protein
MRFIEDLCPPALLYLIFLVIQVGLDASLGLWATLVIKIVLGLAAVVVLDTFCGVGLGVVSWFLVAMPFLITALATAISIGSGFDAMIVGQWKETFYDKTAKTNDLPADSNAITQLTSK